jgi:hypothetical protein
MFASTSCFVVEIAWMGVYQCLSIYDTFPFPLSCSFYIWCVQHWYIFHNKTISAIAMQARPVVQVHQVTNLGGSSCHHATQRPNRHTGRIACCWGHPCWGVSWQKERFLVTHIRLTDLLHFLSSLLCSTNRHNSQMEKDWSDKRNKSDTFAWISSLLMSSGEIALRSF